MPSKKNAYRPELLAPAGDFECIRAAVENGADAVYFGLQHGFNARARAANIELSELPQVMCYLRQRGVKGYVTLNTLVFADELPAIERVVREVNDCGVDAVLVQDLGLAWLIRQICPQLPIHASTQMTLTSAESIRVAEFLGIERVVLARELSVKEIRKIRQLTTMPLEVFVHGALCVAYSGQCLTSESLGGRSANRGQCAQACRLPYDLLCDGRDVDLGAVKYLLSPQDLAAYAFIPDLIDAGVCSFKIEGRLKSPEYVANITRHYRRAIDGACQGRNVEFTRDEIREMELSFSRGFSPGWLRGCDHKMLVPGLSSSKRGVLVGTVGGLRGGQVTVNLAAPLAEGDGVVFDGDREVGDEQGGRIFELRRRGERVKRGGADESVELLFGHGGIDISKLHPGQRLWKTDDPQLTMRLRKSFTGPDPVCKTALQLQVEAVVGQPIRIVGRAASGAHCVAISSQVLEPARKHPLTVDVLRKQLGRLGGTVYELVELNARLEGSPMAPLSVLGELRHEMIRQLDESIAAVPHRNQLPQTLVELRSSNIAKDQKQADQKQGDQCAPQLRVLCRSLQQLDEVLALQVESVYVDFQDIREYREAVRRAREFGREIFVATPRIQKPDERGILLALKKYQADGILVRNLGGVSYYQECGVPFVADFSLNATNDLTTKLLLDKGALRVTASYDMNRDQLLELVQVVSASTLEIVIHQHMPMFHMEHCVFCAVLSPGTNKTNCGRPCDRHAVHLRDRIGVEHTLKADVGCRNTLFNAIPQSAAEVMPTLLQHGLRHFRIELLDESADEIRKILELYRELLAGRVSGHDVWGRLRASNRVGVTRGTLEERRNPLAIL